jgi:hypothetical protein
MTVGTSDTDKPEAAEWQVNQLSSDAPSALPLKPQSLQRSIFPAWLNDLICWVFVISQMHPLIYFDVVSSRKSCRGAIWPLSVCPAIFHSSYRNPLHSKGSIDGNDMMIGYPIISIVVAFRENSLTHLTFRRRATKWWELPLHRVST